MPPATYEKLLSEILPQVLETEKQYEQIGARLGDLIGKGRSRTPDETKLMRLLALLVEDYDRRHAMPPDDSTPAERLQFSNGALREDSRRPAARLRPAETRE